VAEISSEYGVLHRACMHISRSNTDCHHSIPAPVDITSEKLKGTSIVKDRVGLWVKAGHNFFGRQHADLIAYKLFLLNLWVYVCANKGAKKLQRVGSQIYLSVLSQMPYC